MPIETYWVGEYNISATTPDSASRLANFLSIAPRSIDDKIALANVNNISGRGYSCPSKALSDLTRGSKRQGVAARLIFGRLVSITEPGFVNLMYYVEPPQDGNSHPDITSTFLFTTGYAGSDLKSPLLLVYRRGLAELAVLRQEKASPEVVTEPNELNQMAQIVEAEFGQALHDAHIPYFTFREGTVRALDLIPAHCITPQISESHLQ